MTDFTDRVANFCEQEYQYFGRGTKKEWMPDVYLRVGEYWDQLSTISKYKKWKGYNGRSDVVFGKDGSVKVNKNKPWSAAFVSWIAHQAGASSEFEYSSSHSTYILAALAAAKSKNSTKKFIARRHGEYTPKVGDLIACERRPDVDPNFDNYADYVKNKKYEAHCDFVVKIDDGKLWVIGGNISNTVTKRAWPTKSGLIAGADPDRKENKVICIIECKL